MVFRTCHVKTCSGLRNIPRVYVCIRRFTLCLLSLQMEIDRGWSFTGTGKALLAPRALRAVTAGVRIWKSDGDQVQSRGIVCVRWVLMRDYCKKQEERQRERLKVT